MCESGGHFFSFQRVAGCVLISLNHRQMLKVNSKCHCKPHAMHSCCCCCTCRTPVAVWEICQKVCNAEARLQQQQQWRRRWRRLRTEPAAQRAVACQNIYCTDEERKCAKSEGEWERENEREGETEWDREWANAFKGFGGHMSAHKRKANRNAA